MAAGRLLAAFNDSKLIPIRGYSQNGKVICIGAKDGEKLSENLSGFKIVKGDSIICDASDFKYRWDVINHREGMIYYTNDPDSKQTTPFRALNESDVLIQEESLSNEELTEAVADLMYEISAAKLGL